MRTLHLILPRRTPSRMRLANTMIVNPESSRVASDRSLVPIVIDDLGESLASLGDPQRQRSALGATPGDSQRVTISALQRTHDFKARPRKHAAIIGAPEILPLSPKLRRVVGQHGPSAIDDRETRKGVLSAAF